jgi:transcriptional regulator with XRE-family HTH domain
MVDIGINPPYSCVLGTNRVAMLEKNEFYMLLGANLRAKREALGLRQAEVAESVGISRTSLTNIECGRQRILVDQLAEICARLAVTPSELIPVEAPRSRPAQAKLAQIPAVKSFLRAVEEGNRR